MTLTAPTYQLPSKFQVHSLSSEDPFRGARPSIWSHGSRKNDSTNSQTQFERPKKKPPADMFRVDSLGRLKRGQNQSLIRLSRRPNFSPQNSVKSGPASILSRKSNRQRQAGSMIQREVVSNGWVDKSQGSVERPQRPV